MLTVVHCLGAFSLAVGAFLLAVGAFVYNGKVLLLSTSTDCEQRSSTVSKKAPTASKERSFPQRNRAIQNAPIKAWPEGWSPRVGNHFRGAPRAASLRAGQTSEGLLRRGFGEPELLKQGG